MVDGKHGVMPDDKILADSIRKSNKPCIIAVNKCDEYNTDNLVLPFHEFGLNNIMPISSLNGRLTGNLLDGIVDKLKIRDSTSIATKKSLRRFSIVLFTEIIHKGVIKVVKIIKSIEIPSTPTL